MLRATTGIEVGVNGRRRRNVLRGDGMLTPVRRFIWDGEVYKPGRTRLAPDHPAARSELAHLLKPAYARDQSPEVLRFLERRRAGRIGRGKSQKLLGPYWRLGSTESRGGRGA